MYNGFQTSLWYAGLLLAETLYVEDALWMFKLSITRIIFSAFGYMTSDRYFIPFAQSYTEMFPYAYMVHPSKRSNKSKDTACPLTGIFGIHFFLISWTHSLRIPRFAQQLVRLFIHTDNWYCRIIGLLINIKDIFHACYELRTRLAWETPVFTSMRS